MKFEIKEIDNGWLIYFDPGALEPSVTVHKGTFKEVLKYIKKGHDQVKKDDC